MSCCFPKVDFSHLKSLWKHWGVVRVFVGFASMLMRTPCIWPGKVGEEAALWPSYNFSFPKPVQQSEWQG